MNTYIIINSESSGQPATRHLSGFSGSESMLLFATVTPLKGQIQNVTWAYLMVDGRYWTQAENETKKGRIQVHIIRVSKDYTTKQALKDLITRHTIKNCIVDSRITYYANIIAIQDLGLAIHPQPDLYAKIRELKNNDELTFIRKAQSIALKAYEKLLPEIIPGVTENYLAAKLEFLMKQEGAEKAAFEPIVASGKNSALPHARATEKVLHDSDSVIVDFGCVYEGYCSDFTRTVLMPDASTEIHRIYHVVKKAQKSAMRVAIEGALLKDIDIAARSIIEKQGYGPLFTHATGHGVGMAVHELPHVSTLSEGMLRKGHVITIEPGIYAPGVGGVRLEEMVIV